MSCLGRRGKVDEETRDLQVAGFPEDLHRAVKATAAVLGITAKAAYVEAARSWVHANRDVPVDLSMLDP